MNQEDRIRRFLCSFHLLNIQGLSLVEIIFATSIVSIAILGTLSGVIGAHNLNDVSKEYILASHALQEQSEQARQRILELAAQKEYAKIYDDFGTIGAPVNFDVPGLSRVTPETPCGEIVVIQDEDSPWLGNPLDMDLDGDFASDTWNDGDDNDYALFPVRVTITWNCKGRSVSQTITTIVSPQEYPN